MRVAAEMSRGGAGSAARHPCWRAAVRADGGGRLSHEHQQLCMLLGFVGCNDQVDLRGLVCLELAAR
eukprot:894609-Lingulodinium_polyedra.AAC.1